MIDSTATMLADSGAGYRARVNAGRHLAGYLVTVDTAGRVWSSHGLTSLAAADVTPCDSDAYGPLPGADAGTAADEGVSPRAVAPSEVPGSYAALYFGGPLAGIPAAGVRLAGSYSARRGVFSACGGCTTELNATHTGGAECAGYSGRVERASVVDSLCFDCGARLVSVVGPHGSALFAHLNGAACGRRVPRVSVFLADASRLAAIESRGHEARTGHALHGYYVASGDAFSRSLVRVCCDAEA